MNLKIGDIVEHTISGKRKVIVGIENNRYLCLEENELTADGRVKENSRVSVHSGNNFYLTGNIANVQVVNPRHLFSKKKITANLKPARRPEHLLIPVFVSILALIILAAATSFIFNFRKAVENLLLSKALSIKEQIKNEIKTEAIKTIKK